MLLWHFCEKQEENQDIKTFDQRGYQKQLKPLSLTAIVNWENNSVQAAWCEMLKLLNMKPNMLIW